MTVCRPEASIFDSLSRMYVRTYVRHMFCGLHMGGVHHDTAVLPARATWMVPLLPSDTKMFSFTLSD